MPNMFKEHAQDSDGPLGPPPGSALVSEEEQRFGAFEVTFVERK